MFGVIVAGRLVQTDLQQIEETKFVVNIPNADSINHIVVFMTGQTPFPDALGGAVYWSWPSVEGSSWQLLGHISNAKPSAIFKVANLKKDASDSSDPFSALSLQPSHTAQIGISVEPLIELSQQTPANNTNASTVETFREFSVKMLENAYNFVSSFAMTQAQMTPNPSESYLPMSALTQWYNNFQRRLEQNPFFWRS